MLKSLHVLILGLAMLAPLAFGQLGSLSDFDGVLQAKFSLELAETTESETKPVSPVYSLTSGDLIREYELPDTSRIYWVFYYDGPHIHGGLVIADNQSGEVYSLIAQASQMTLDDLMGADEVANQEAFDDSGIESLLSAKFTLHFDIDGLAFSAQAVMKFQFTPARNVSYLRMTSVGDVSGRGVLDDQTPFAVTGGSISASGMVAELD